jgi:DNA-3-methyladenine glycosylase
VPAAREVLTLPALQVAPLLLGATLISTVGAEQVTVRITEVEAYEGAEDPASHAFHGQTKRNAVMFGPAGHLYCYFVYGMHWCANITCGPEGVASAVLLRAAEITAGLDYVLARTPVVARLAGPGRPAGRGRPAGPAKLASGPARLARCLGLDGSHTGLDLLDPASPVRLAALGPGQPSETGPRVGVAVAADRPWRFWLADAPSVSSYRAARKKSARPTRQT